MWVSTSKFVTYSCFSTACALNTNFIQTTDNHTAVTPFAGHVAQLAPEKSTWQPNLGLITLLESRLCKGGGRVMPNAKGKDISKVDCFAKIFYGRLRAAKCAYSEVR